MHGRDGVRAWKAGKKVCAGPRPIARERVLVRTLIQAVRAAYEDRNMRERVVAISKKVRVDDGVANAVDVVDGYLGQMA